MSAQPELIQKSVVERHGELCTQLSAGVVSMCTALWSIRAEKTYTAQGCKSFGEFLSRAGISETTGRLYANVGPVLVELQRTGHADLVKHAELLKPIHLMIGKAARECNEDDALRVAKRQADVVRLAAQVASRAQQPLTAEVIELVAEKNFRWLPDRKRKAKKGEPEQTPAWEHPFRANVRSMIAHAQAQISGLSPENAVHVAAVHRLDGFMDLAQWFADVVQEAEHASGDFFSPESR